MVTVLRPTTEGDRLTYHLKEPEQNFTSIFPPINLGYEGVFSKDNRKFFEEYRKNVLSKYTAPMYKWNKTYESYSPHPKLKYRWEEMYSGPNIRLTFKDEIKIKEVEDFYLLCQYQRAYYNDYTGNLHPMDYFRRDQYKWACAPQMNDTYVEIPQSFAKYKHPHTLPLTTATAWLEPLEPCRRLAGKRDPYPSLKFL